MTRPVTEFEDIQGVIHSGYGRLNEATFLLLRITDAAAARTWIRGIAGEAARRVTTVADLRGGHQDNALNIAFTAPGLRSLGIQDAILGAFSREFHDGMASAEARYEGRPRRLGDVGENAPDNWSWGAGAYVPDVLLMLYGQQDSFATFADQVKGDIAAGFAIAKEFRTSYKTVGDKDRVEHFGFIDGISQPEIDWSGNRNPGERDELEYGNLIAPGEIILGYRNEYGLYEDRPLPGPDDDPTGILAQSEDAPGRRDLARNGSYLVFRQLRQDVEGFWRFVTAHGGSDLAEAMVGRRLGSGDPLVARVTARISGVGPDPTDIRRNGFTFDADPDGLSCPFGAHIRRANPRTADMPGGQQGFVSYALRMLGFKQDGPREDLISAARFHRIIRRGRAYGSFSEPGQARGSEAERGLHFICLNASISRQFEFIQNAWLANATFNGLSGEADPLLGNRLDFPEGHPTARFTLPQEAGPCRRVTGLPQFVTVRGGAYFFLPGRRALRFFGQ